MLIALLGEVLTVVLEMDWQGLCIYCCIWGLLDGGEFASEDELGEGWGFLEGGELGIFLSGSDLFSIKGFNCLMILLTGSSM